MVVLNRQPVFEFSFDDGKTWRLIDANTNNFARDAHGDFLDGGGITNGLLANAEARRINCARGILGDEPKWARDTYRRSFVAAQAPQGKTAEDDGRGDWLYRQRQDERKTWAAIATEYESVRAANRWPKLTVSGIRTRVSRYARDRGLPLRKKKGGAPQRPK